MKRRRHDIVELSSDDSSDDFVPAKLKSKRVSIVLNKDPVTLKTRKNGVSRSCKNAPQQPSSSKRSDQSESDQREERVDRKRGRPRKEDKLRKEDKPRVRLTMKLPLSPEIKADRSKNKSVDRTVKLKPDFSDLNDSLLIESLKPAPTKTVCSKSSDENEKLSSPTQVKYSDSDRSEQPRVQANKLSTPTLLPSHTSPLSRGKEEVSPCSNGSGALVLNVEKATSRSRCNAETSGVSQERKTSGSLVSLNDLKGIQERKQESKDLRSSTLGYSFCQICQKNISGYSAERRRSHVNKLVFWKIC
jgi:hypothetical protein